MTLLARRLKKQGAEAAEALERTPGAAPAVDEDLWKAARSYESSRHEAEARTILEAFNAAVGKAVQEDRYEDFVLEYRAKLLGGAFDLCAYHAKALAAYRASCDRALHRRPCKFPFLVADDVLISIKRMAVSFRETGKLHAA